MIDRGPTRRMVVLSGIALAACGGSDNPATATVQGAEVAVLGPIFHTLSIRLSSAADVEVLYATDGGPTLRVRSNDPTRATHVIALTRLRAQRTYRYRIRVLPSNDPAASDASGEFTTTALPDDLAAMSFAVTGTPTVPLIFLSCRSAFTGGVIVDASGQVVWYARTPIAPQGAIRRRNGNWAILLNGVGIQEFDALGRLVQQLDQAAVPGNETIHHGLTESPEGQLMFLTLEPGTFGAETLRGEALWAWAGEGQAPVKRWSAWAHFDPAVDRGARSVPSDWLHANSIAYGSAGNVLMSFHFLDQVISIAPDLQSIEWRLGGPGSSFALAADQLTSGQHSAREVGPGRVLLFDNGFARADQGQWSRAIEFEIDAANGTAHTVWQYRPDPDIWATVISSARRIANGNTVVTFGTPAGIVGSTGPLVVHEVDPSGRLVAAMQIDAPVQSTIFQGDALDTIGGEAAVT